MTHTHGLILPLSRQAGSTRKKEGAEKHQGEEYECWELSQRELATPMILIYVRSCEMRHP